MGNGFISIGRNVGRNELDIPLGGMPEGMCYILYGRNAGRNLLYIPWEECREEYAIYIPLGGIGGAELSVPFHHK